MKKGFTKYEAPELCGLKDFLPPPPYRTVVTTKPSGRLLHFQRGTTCLGLEYFFTSGIYGLLNFESLCVIKSLAGLSGIQSHNCWSNSIIFKYAVSAARELVNCAGFTQCGITTIRLGPQASPLKFLSATEIWSR